MTWRYVATRLNGDGTETVIDPEVPLGSDATFTTNRNAPIEMSASISPEYRHLLDELGQPLLRKWSTAIYAEKDGEIRAGGILVDDSISGSTLSLDLMGFSGYPNGQPYTEGNTWPPNPYPVNGIEPMDAVREIWRHLQAQPQGNLGVSVSNLNTGKLVGKMVAQGTYDTQNGPLSFEYTPFLLRWFETFDLGDAMSNIVENTPLEFQEEHAWNSDRSAIMHSIVFGYPRLGSRRNDYRFVAGENVAPPGVDPPGDEYASAILGLGAGEGSAMMRADTYRASETRIRRALVFEDKSASTAGAINTSSQSELFAHAGVDEVTSIVALPEHVRQLQGIRVGDEVRLLGDTPYRSNLDMWVRIESKTETPASGALEFGVTRTDRLA